MDIAAFKYAIVGAFKTLTTDGLAKAIAASVMAACLHKHAVLFYAFTLLVFLDCATKWIEISYKQLCEAGRKEPSVLQAIWGIPAARRQGSISSEVMKHRFLGKLVVYMLCVAAAAVIDVVMQQLNNTQWAVSLVIGYLVATELLSIIENLSDAGCKNLTGLSTLVKKKLT